MYTFNSRNNFRKQIRLIPPANRIKNDTRTANQVSGLTSFLQPKLKINSSNDRFEQEADNIAEKVVAKPSGLGPIQKDQESDMPQKSIAGHISGLDSANVQLKCAECEEDEEVVQRKATNNIGIKPNHSFRSDLNTLKGGGQPLDRKTKNFMSSRFGVDFSQVRIHNDSRASKMNQSINAKAFTSGNDIFFNKGEYRPSSISGKKLLAHELVHTLQQSSSEKTEGYSNYDISNISSSEKDSIRLKRGPDVSYKKHYSFYLLVGGGKEVAVQFVYSGTGSQVEVKMASMKKSKLVKENLTLTNPGNFSPEIIYEDGVTTIFDLDGDGKGDLEVHVTLDSQYSIDFLTSDSNPGNPKYKTHQIKETFAVMKWPGVEKVIKFSTGMDQQSWVIRPHPHPHVQFMYYNVKTKEAFIPSEFNLPSNFKGLSRGKSVHSKKEITVLDWGESWNGFNVAGGVLTWDQIDASSVENMVNSIIARVGPGDCIEKLTIIGHGSPGGISVGDGTSKVEGKYIKGGALDSTSDIYDSNLATLLAKLTPLFCSNSSVILRGCNVGDGKLGKQFTQLLANLWRVNVKAHIGTVRGGGYWTTGKWKSSGPKQKQMD